MKETTLVATEVHNDMLALMSEVEDLILKDAAGEGQEVTITRKSWIEDKLDEVQDDIDDGINRLCEWYGKHTDDHPNTRFQGIDATIGTLFIKPAAAAVQYKGVEVYFTHNVDGKGLNSYLTYKLYNDVRINNVKFTTVDGAIDKLRVFSLVGKALKRTHI